MIKRYSQLQNLIGKIYSHHLTPFYSQMFPTSLSKVQGEYLVQLTQNANPKGILELGFGFGVSALWIELGNVSQVPHIIVDPYRISSLNSSIYKFIKTQKNIYFEENDTSQIFLAQALKEFKSFDFILLDADARFDGFMTDIYFISKLLKPNGTLVARNVWSPSVRKGLLFTIKNLPFELVSFTKIDKYIIKYVPFLGDIWLKRKCQRYDLCVLKRVGKDTREWNHFKSF